MQQPGRGYELRFVPSERITDVPSKWNRQTSAASFPFYLTNLFYNLLLKYKHIWNINKSEGTVFLKNCHFHETFPLQMYPIIHKNNDFYLSFLLSVMVHFTPQLNKCC